MSLPPLDGTAVVTLGLVGVIVGGGLLGQAKMLGRWSQQADSLEAAIQGKDGQPGLVQDVKQIASGQVKLQQQVKNIDSSIHDGLEDKVEKMGGKVDKMGMEFTELRGKVTMFIEMNPEKGGRKHASK